MSTRSGRVVHTTKRYRPEESLSNKTTAAAAVGGGDEDEDFEEEPIRRTRPALRNLPETLAASSKAHQDTLIAVLKETTTQTVILKKTLRYLKELNEVLVDIHEALAIVTKEPAHIPAPVQQQQPTELPPLNVSKEDIQVPTLPLE